MHKGLYYSAWAIMQELGEADQWADWVAMRDDYHRNLSWDG